MISNPVPTIQDPTWNAYRAAVVAAVTDVELQMVQRQIGLDTLGMTCEVAQLLKLSIATQHEYEALFKLVQAVRHIAREALRVTRENRAASSPCHFSNAGLILPFCSF